MDQTYTYHLPDLNLLQSNQDKGFMVFRPMADIAVLGRSNTSGSSLQLDSIKADGVKIIQRHSGGESVFISPKMCVISIKMPLKMDIKAQNYFAIANQPIQKCLLEMGVHSIHQKGISDLSINQKKILGSSIYRTSSAMFYHAILNLEEEVEKIAKYLKHPKREPDYRNGRSHNEFITSLLLEGYAINFDDFKGCLELEIQQTLNEF